jgi:heme-degrading monooxygenase HmoA
MTDQLFAAIRRGKVKPGLASEFAKRVKAGALPAMQKMDGFKGYYLVAGADDTIIAVSLFTNKSVAETSTQALMPWIKENLGPLLASPTEAVDGIVLVSAMSD